MALSRGGEAASRHPIRLSDFLRARHREVIASWIQRARELSPARELSTPSIIDHVPQILLRIADVVEAALGGRPITLEQLPHVHAVDRLSRGFDLDQIVTEY